MKNSASIILYYIMETSEREYREIYLTPLVPLSLRGRMKERGKYGKRD
jgi:hypothetical protein